MKEIKLKEDLKVFSFINSEDCKEYEDLVLFLENNRLPFRENWIFYFLGKIKGLGNSELVWLFDSDDDNKMSRYHLGGYFSGKLFWWGEYLKDETNKLNDIKREMKFEVFEDENKDKLDEYNSGYNCVSYEIKDLQKSIESMYFTINLIFLLKFKQDEYIEINEIQFNELTALKNLIGDLKEKIEKIFNQLDNTRESIINKYNIPNEDVYRRFVQMGYEWVNSNLESYEINDALLLEKEIDYINFPSFDIEDNEFCEACQESPCMCSDRGKTSRIHDW